jgi:DNA-directed RNA polymerase subunit RPC12/RpoP
MDQLSRNRFENGPDGTRQCQNCGSHVTDAFARVFGDNREHVYRCLSCANTAELLEGETAVPPSDR